MQRRQENRDLPDEQPMLDFDAVISRAEIRSRDEVALTVDPDVPSSDYSPVQRTAEYMQRSLRVEEAWEGTIAAARERLLETDARTLYLEFLTDLAKMINRASPRTARLVEIVRAVAIRGLGMGPQHLQIREPQRGGTTWRVDMDVASVERHLAGHLVGPNFLNVLRPVGSLWKNRPPLIAGSDVSQHSSAVPVPSRFFRRTVPFVLNNAAGAMFRVSGTQARYDNVFNPRPDDALLRWMLIDPSYQDELEPEDYRRVLASAMDVGQYKFDRDYLLKADRRPPDIVLRDGSLFPQDAYLDNFAVENRRGDFTREAIKEFLDCLIYAQQLNVIYCGVAKSVQLKVYSAPLDWFIARHVDSTWDVGSYTLNDGQAMSVLLSTPSFAADGLEEVVATCLVRRAFTTRANLNTRVSDGDYHGYFERFQATHPNIDITPFIRLCELANVYLFFIGHSKTPQQQLPRYEFFTHPTLGEPLEVAGMILAGIRQCSLMIDHDHAFMADEPIVYLIPSVTQQAHQLSKDVGKHIDRMTGQWIMSRYKDLVAKVR